MVNTPKKSAFKQTLESGSRVLEVVAQVSMKVASILTWRHLGMDNKLYSTAVEKHYSDILFLGKKIEDSEDKLERDKLATEGYGLSDIVSLYIKSPAFYKAALGEFVFDENSQQEIRRLRLLFFTHSSGVQRVARSNAQTRATAGLSEKKKRLGITIEVEVWLQELGISELEEIASKDELTVLIKSQHRALAKVLHPDGKTEDKLRDARLRKVLESFDELKKYYGFK